MGNTEIWSIETIGVKGKRNNYWHPGKKTPWEKVTYFLLVNTLSRKQWSNIFKDT